MGKLPDVLRWPKRRGEQGELSIRVDWKGQRYEVFLSDTTLEDLAELGHEPEDRVYLDVIDKNRRAILKAAADKIDSRAVTPDRRVHLSEPDIREAFSRLTRKRPRSK